MIEAAVINSGVHGSSSAFKNNALVNYTYLNVDENFSPDLTPYHLLLTGNPTDHIALYKIKDKIADFLNQGKTLFCFSGWYTDYIPGNKWIMERDIKSIDIRYFKKSDKNNLLTGVNINELIYQNGISGWWACGHIEPSENAEIILVDTLNRPIMILDQNSTNGTIICTSGGPLNGKKSKNEEDLHAVNVLYNNLIDYIYKKQRHEQENRISI
ncbi:hypothetical protein A5893_16120 [Pedobacter psychrophilus]|uniref:Uncharacterized protein n=1 Tax=Pedobacter psychrophilus TaxID=1826909 RepID=A0A179DCX0_9SPHI|nr:hypothetical protein [Pedobacter psychrophilus]OAQ38313.1 hypothetical protein A5893_16120 [Pedobacter psychrophilus]